MIAPGVVAVAIPSRSTPGRVYRVQLGPGAGASCECPDHQYRQRDCKHITDVRQQRGGTPMTDPHPHQLAHRAAAALPSSGEWATMLEMARVLVPTQFLPSSIKTPEQAVTVMLKARELGIPPLYGLSNIVIVQGRPTCSAELMLALIYRDQGDAAVVVEESTPEICRVSYRRRGWDRARSFAFGIEDARRAKLAGKETWAQYPQAMLRARCISAVARLAFPDSIAGMYLPEELGAAVQVGADGAVEVAPEPEPAPGLSPRMRALVAEMDQAVADDATTDVVDPAEPWPDPDPEGPVTERTKLLAAAFADAIEQANPRIRVRLPEDRLTEGGWLAWMSTKQAEWAASPHNPARAAS